MLGFILQRLNGFEWIYFMILLVTNDCYNIWIGEWILYGVELIIISYGFLMRYAW